MSQDLRCAGCGAPLPAAAAADVTTCEFCGATAVPPPAVVERRVERVVVVRPADEVAEGKLRCPRCAHPLREASAAGALLRGCQSCGGLLLDGATVQRLQDHRDPGVEDAARTLLGAWLRRAQARPEEISCPVCGAAMRRVVDRLARHHVDVCDAHGTWFDGDELPAFIRAFAELRAGELDDEDLAAAGIPGSAPKEGDGGFFTDLFSLLRPPRHRGD
jgi:Zn-finger nucleic acid-binding protein